MNFKISNQNFKNQFFSFLEWKEVQDAGKRKDRCVGSGKEKDSRKKKQKEKLEEQEPNKKNPMVLP